jgi:ubiquinol-cytochrome c reductase cytochrome c subunit
MVKEWRTVVLGLCLSTACGAALIAACAAAAPPATGQRGPDPATGDVLYATHCSSCHGLRGTGTAQGPPLIGVGAAAVDFMLATGRMPMADPNQPTLRQPPRLSRAERDALIAYVVSLGPGGPPIPEVHPERGTLAHGGQLFAATCAPCHGADGQGAAVAQGQIAPSLHEATPTQIAEAVRIGPGPMPPFSSRVLDASDLDALVRYVLFLRHAPDPGGLSLGHEGPVIEGFVAWLLGLGLMLVVVRLIGTTT